MAAKQLLDVGPVEYMKSLLFTEGSPQLIAVNDGARLFRMNDEHFFVMQCAVHDDHEGHRNLLTLLPATWECFNQGWNGEGAAYEVFHYGPPEPEVMAGRPAVLA